MKRTLLAAATFFVLGGLNAQMEILHDGTGPDVSGTIIEMNVTQFTPTPYQPKFYINNISGADQQWRVTRVKQSVPAAWTDFICWPPQCYPGGSNDIYTTPSTQANPAPTIVNGTYTTTLGATAEMKGQIFPNGQNTGVGLYMYYISDANGVYLDSVGVRINYALGVNENTTEAKLSISPNPASNYINIETEGLETGTIQIIDVLGNSVLKETISGSSKTIDLTSFRNGIYFVRLESEKFKATTRKIVVKH